MDRLLRFLSHAARHLNLDLAQETWNHSPPHLPAQGLETRHQNRQRLENDLFLYQEKDLKATKQNQQ